jgi:hypothetical protein
MLRRAASETPNGVAILVSDMENDCPPRGLPLGLRMGNKLFVIPVGFRLHPVEERFDEIQYRLAKSMPSVRVIEMFRIQEVFDAIVHP